MKIINNKVSKVFNIDFSDESDEFDDEFNTLTKEKLVGEGISPDIINQIEEGDFIDTKQFRGVGLWYFNGKSFLKTHGPYGYTIPSDAWSMVEKYGLDFFDKSNQGGGFILLPKDAEIYYKNKAIDNSKGNHVILLKGNLSDDDYVVINDIKYEGYSIAEDD